MGDLPVTLMDPYDPSTWTNELRRTIQSVRFVFDSWYNERASKSAKTFDPAVHLVGQALSAYAITGWHLTRLLDSEVDSVQTDGLRPLTPEFVRERIEEAERGGHLPPDIAAHLHTHNLGSVTQRAGKIFFGIGEVPSESYCERLLRQWGGEAIYWGNEDDSEVGPVLRSIGRPAFIDANVPIAGLYSATSLVEAVVRADLVDAGLMPSHTHKFEFCSTRPIPGECIAGVLLHPDPAFVARTRCESWSKPLK